MRQIPHSQIRPEVDALEQAHSENLDQRRARINGLNPRERARLPRYTFHRSGKESRLTMPPAAMSFGKLHQLVVRNQAIPPFEKHCQLLAGHV